MKTPILVTSFVTAFALAFAVAAVNAAQAAPTPIGAPPAPPPALAHESTASSAGELNDQVRLNVSITVTGDSVRLGDIFSGDLSRPDKVVAQAPAPGQHIVLSAEWLGNIARTYGLNWQPMSTYDRAVVTQPGRTITPKDILTAVKTALIAKGLPKNYDLTPAAAIDGVTVAAANVADVQVREALYDPAAKEFSAVAEIETGMPKPVFLPLRGTAFAAVTVPVLKENAPKNKVITADMIETVDIREDGMRPTTMTDAGALIGMAPRIFLRAGQPIQENEVAQITLIDVPVLSVDMTRDAQITKSRIVMTPFNAAELPHDAVLEVSELIGKTPRRFLAAGAPIHRGDVQLLHQVQIPVAARDLPKGAVLTESDLTVITLNDTDVVGNVVADESDIVGRTTKHPMRAGQMMHTFDIARPTVVDRGKFVTVVYSSPLMNLTIQGIAQEAGGVGDVIRVSNSKSNTTISGEIVDAHTVRVAGPHQTASAN